MQSGRRKLSAADMRHAPGELQQPGRSPWRWPVAMLLLVLALSHVGCAPFRGLRETIQYNDAANDFVMGWRNAVWARQSWHDRKWMYVNQPQFVTFGQGYRDGYAAVAAGGDGCVPPLPPRHYWSWKYQTSEGQAKVAAWFAGYPHGVRAAQEDGAGNFQQIQVSHLIEAQYSPEFRAGKCPECKPTAIPAAPYEILPDGTPRAVSPDPGPGAPKPMSDPMSQLYQPGGYRPEPLVRIPSPAATSPPGHMPHYGDPAGQVVPASAMLPVP